MIIRFAASDSVDVREIVDQFDGAKREQFNTLIVTETPDSWGLEITRGSHQLLKVSWEDLPKLRAMLAEASRAYAER